MVPIRVFVASVMWVSWLDSDFETTGVDDSPTAETLRSGVGAVAVDSLFL